MHAWYFSKHFVMFSIKKLITAIKKNTIKNKVIFVLFLYVRSNGIDNVRVQVKTDGQTERK